MRDWMSRVDPSEVQNSLARILATRRFRDAPRISRFLEFVVEETLQGRSDELKVSLIGRAVFDRGKGFSNADSSIVRTTANRLRLTLDHYNATDGAFDTVKIRLEPGRYAPILTQEVVRSAPSRTSPALQLVAKYQLTADPDTHAGAQRALALALNDEPENVEVLAASAELSLDGYIHGFHDTRASVDCAHRMLERAQRVDVSHWRVHFVGGLIALEERDVVGATELARHIANTAPEPAIGKMAEWLLASAGHPSEMLGPDTLDNHEDPGWFHHPYFLSAYVGGDYELALSEAIAFGMPRFHLGYSFRAAALAQLGLRSAAAHELRKLASLYPRFTKKPGRYLRGYMPREDEIQKVIEGLEKAGIARVSSQF